MRKRIPGPLWITIGTLGVVTMIQLLMSVQRGSDVLAVAVALNVACVVGLLMGHKWAYVATLVLAIAGLMVAMGKGPGNAIGVLFGNGLVVIPMVLSTRFFFPGQPATTDA